MLFLVLAAYLLGSIPFSHLITTWRTGLVIREFGEGHVGSRNVWHVVGPRWGVLTFVLDTLKGFLVCPGGWALGSAARGIGLAGICIHGVLTGCSTGYSG
jgi:glycerol-3-phosphate acyltransferase PlsY